jgi:hypothetical protein
MACGHNDVMSEELLTLTRRQIAEVQELRSAIDRLHEHVAPIMGSLMEYHERAMSDIQANAERQSSRLLESFGCEQAAFRRWAHEQVATVLPGLIQGSAPPERGAQIVHEHQRQILVLIVAASLSSAVLASVLTWALLAP